MDVFSMSSPLAAKKHSNGWSFSKEPRFKSNIRTPKLEFINPGSTLSPRSTSIGFGNRWKPETFSSLGKPPPGSYNIPSTFDSKVGPRLVKSTIQPLSALRHLTPGPGSYETSLNTGRSPPKFSFRAKTNVVKGLEVPSPNTYYPKRTLTEFSGYHSIGFGYGNRKEIASKKDSPGPGTYSIGSEFGKCR